VLLELEASLNFQKNYIFSKKIQNRLLFSTLKLKILPINTWNTEVTFLTIFK